MIPQYEPLHSPKGYQTVQQALLENRLGPGVYCEQFEQALKDKYGFKHVILVNSGTSAIMVAMRAMLGEGRHKVLAPAYTFLAGHNAARFLGYDVDLIDIGNDLVITPIRLHRKLRKQSYDLLLYVNHNAYNNGVMIEDIKRQCDEHGMLMIEDSSQCINVTYGAYNGTWCPWDCYCGTIGDCGILSFSVPKLLTTGQGGAIITADDEIADKCRRLVDHGGGKWRQNRVHEEIGVNLRMSDLNAAYGLGQLEEIDKRYELRTNIHRRYKDLLGDAYISEAHSWMCIYRNTKEHTEFVINRLEEKGIVAKQYYLPIHWNHSFNTCGDHFPGAEQAWKELIYLPSSLNLTQEQIYRISTIINEE